FTLRLPWTLGADFFLRHLLDGDPASNTLSWRWVAGLHTRGKTYQARASNIRKYTNDRFFPEYKLAPDAPALEEPELGPAGDAPGGDLSAPTEDFLLLITEDDGDPATLPGLGQPRGVLAIGATAGRSPLPVGEIATSFAEGVLEDAQTRAEQHFGVEGAVKTDDDPWAETIISAAKDCGASSVVTGFIPVGPAHDRLAEAKPHLASVGIPVHQLMRPIDAATWPYASKGFFNVKKKIPSILTTLGLT
ncbi:MAG: FAD-binding domain-containing protein, partial [Pseudomonadota bacterium]